MNKIIVSFLLIFFIAGCGPAYYWYKSGATLEETEADCYQCYIDSTSQRIEAIHDAQQEAQVTKMPHFPKVENELGCQLEELSFYNCMKGKRYREVSGEYLKRSLRKITYSPASNGTLWIAGE